MQFEVIKLNFLTPLHIGRGRDELDKSEHIYPSDSMKAAIYAIGRSSYPEWENQDRFFSDFRISSCFPYFQDELFFPRPLVNKVIRITDDADAAGSAKRIKRIEYLSFPIFQDILDPDASDIFISRTDLSPDGAFVFSHNMRLNNESAERNKSSEVFMRSAIQQRVLVPGDGTNTRPFYIDRVYFAEGSGLFFLACFANERIRREVFNTLRILGETGIGTDRSVGNGLFEVVWTVDRPHFIDIRDNESGTLQMPLGYYLPTEDEMDSIDLSASKWSLVKRGGYMAGSENERHRHLLKRSIFMFNHGSAFTAKKKLIGKIAELKPEWNEAMHPVWRCGMPIIITV